MEDRVCHSFRIAIVLSVLKKLEREFLMDQSVIDVDSFRFVSGKRLLTILLIDEVWRSSKVERRRVFFCGETVIRLTGLV